MNNANYVTLKDLTRRIRKNYRYPATAHRRKINFPKCSMQNTDKERFNGKNKKIHIRESFYIGKSISLDTDRLLINAMDDRIGFQVSSIAKEQETIMHVSLSNTTPARRSKMTEQANTGLSPEKILIGGRSFNEKLIDIIPFVDPDSTRFIEWLWAVRHNFRSNTYAAEFELPSNCEATIEELIAPLIEQCEFSTIYDSTYYFRGMRMVKIKEKLTIWGKIKSFFGFKPKQNEIPDFFSVVGRCNGVPMVVLCGNKDEVEKHYNYYKDKYVEPKSITFNELVGFGKDGPIVKKITKLETEMEQANDAFYPWLEEGIESYVKRFAESNANVLVLYGEPGTGKSTFLRTLLFLLGRENIHLACNENILLDPAFPTWLETTGSKPAIAIEDADNLVSSRESGNHQMSAILNFTQGIVQNDVKVIISTNLGSTQKMDSALLRAGRAFDIIKFPFLSPDEANAARKSIGLPEIDFGDSGKPMTLSEALNYKNVRDMAIHKRDMIGFTQRK